MVKFIVSSLLVAAVVIFVIHHVAAQTSDQDLLKTNTEAVAQLLSTQDKAWLANHLTLRIADPNAFPSFHYYEEDETLELKIVRILAEEQLNGALSIEKDDGAVFSIHFPIGID